MRTGTPCSWVPASPPGRVVGTPPEARGALSGERAVWGAPVQLDGAPAVPGDHRAVGAMGIAQRFELARGGHRDLPREAVTLADAEVADRPHVEAPEPEDQ